MKWKYINQLVKITYLIIKKNIKVENKLEYIGSETSDIENMKIANPKGLIPLRYVNTNIGGIYFERRYRN